MRSQLVLELLLVSFSMGVHLSSQQCEPGLEGVLSAMLYVYSRFLERAALLTPVSIPSSPMGALC